MLYLGCHLSSAAGFAAMGKTAVQLNANTFQFFLRNPRGGAAKDINPDYPATGGKLSLYLEPNEEYDFTVRVG